MSHPSATGRGIPQRLMGRLDSINIPVPDDEAVAASLFKVNPGTKLIKALTKYNKPRKNCD